jgi:hypothetical protein
MKIPFKLQTIINLFIYSVLEFYCQCKPSCTLSNDNETVVRVFFRFVQNENICQDNIYAFLIQANEICLSFPLSFETNG